MSAKTKSKKSIDSLKKQKVDGKKVKGGFSAGSIHNASSNALKAGSISSSARIVIASRTHPTGVPSVHNPLASNKGSDTL